MDLCFDELFFFGGFEHANLLAFCSACVEVVEDLGDHNVEDNIGTDCSDSEDAEQCEHNSLLCHNTIDIFFDTKGHRLLPEEAIEVEHHRAEHGVPIATDLEEHLGHHELVEHRHCECCVEREEPK